MVDLSCVKIAFFDLEDQDMSNIISQCQEYPIDLCLVSFDGTSSIQNKLDLAQKTCGVSFEVCSSETPELTLTVMETMAKLRGYEANEVLLITFDSKAIELAQSKGFMVPADIAEDFIIMRHNQHKIGFTYDTEDLVIPETFYDEEDSIWYKVVGIDDRAFQHFKNLKSVEIPNSVIYIGEGAFYNCISLKSVEVPNSVTHIGGRAFASCLELETLVLGNSVESIGAYAFYNCCKLTSISLPDSVVNIQTYAFSACSRLKSIAIPNSVTTITEGCFANCDSLKQIDIPASVTKIEKNAFQCCANLSFLFLLSFVTELEEYAFFGCDNLRLIVPSSVTKIGSKAFWDVKTVYYNGPETDSCKWGAQFLVRS